MNFALSVMLYLIKIAVFYTGTCFLTILVWVLGLKQDSIREDNGHLHQKVESEAIVAADKQQTKDQEKHHSKTNLKAGEEIKNTLVADGGQLKPMWESAFGWGNVQIQDHAECPIKQMDVQTVLGKDKEEKEAEKQDHESNLQPESKDKKEKDEITKNEMLVAEDIVLKPTPDVVVTEHLVETENDLEEIENMLSQMNLSPNQQLHKIAIDQNSSLNKKVKDRQVAIENGQDKSTTPSTPLEGQFNFVTPETKHLNEDEESSLLKKMKHQREKIETDTLEFSSQPIQYYVTPENKKPSSAKEESTLIKKLKQQREKLDTVDSADGPNIDLRINTFKQAATVAVEDALAQKLKQQLKKIDDNFRVKDVTTRHEAKSLVEDALGEKLKKQQQKIDGLYEVVVEAVSHHESESLVEDALAEKLKKRREKMEEGVENIDASFNASNNQKSSITSWETRERGGTLDRKLRKQRKKMAEAGTNLHPEASENSEMVQRFQDGNEMNVIIGDIAKAVDADSKLQDMEGNDERMTLLIDPAQMARTRE